MTANSQMTLLCMVNAGIDCIKIIYEKKILFFRSFLDMYSMPTGYEWTVLTT